MDRQTDIEVTNGGSVNKCVEFGQTDLGGGRRKNMDMVVSVILLQIVCSNITSHHIVSNCHTPVYKLCVFVL